MQIVNIHEAKTHLSRLIEQAAKGEPRLSFSKAGEAIGEGNSSAIDAPLAGAGRRLGFMSGQIAVPDDFDRMGKTEIERLFGDL